MQVSLYFVVAESKVYCCCRSSKFQELPGIYGIDLTAIEYMVGTIMSTWSLFRQPHYQPQAFPLLEFLFTLLFALSCAVVASVFSVIQWHSRPLTLQTLTISNLSLMASLPSDYVCDCSLPAYLEGVRSVQNLKNMNTSQVQPAHCYRKDALQTVTVVQFSNNTASYLPGVFLPLSGSSQPNFRAFHNGFNITQSPVELELWHGDPDEILWRSGILTLPLLEGSSIMQLSIAGILNALYFDFPRGYMRMTFRYWCTNCTYCGLDKLLDLPGFAGMDVKSWASCGGWGSYGDKCLHPDPRDPPGYEGRCSIYPTYDVPMAARLKQFFTTFQNMPNISYIGSTHVDEPEGSGKIDLELNLLHVNVSHFTENEPMTYGFVEVDKLSSAWSTLSQQFPGIGHSCGENTTIEVCDGTSFCNAFKTSADLGSSSISFSCTDFRDDYIECLKLANDSGNSYWSETLCPRDFRCRNVPRYSVVYKLEGKNFDNQLMAGRMEQSFNDTYAWGVCSNTYENVVRNGDDQLWATECTEFGLCHLTGNYNSPNDASWEEPKSSADLLEYTTPLYICYAARKQRVLPWAISTAGLMFGWISSVLVGVRCVYFVVDWVAQRMQKTSTSCRQKESGAGVPAELASLEDDVVALVSTSYSRALEERPLFPSSKPRRNFSMPTRL